MKAKNLKNSEIKEILPFLEYLSKLSSKEQKQFLSTANSKLIRILSNLCYNFNRGYITTDENHIKKLKKYGNLIHVLCKKSHTLRKRKQILQTGGFLPTLLSTIVPLLAQALFQKK